ncbi:adenosine deaminase [Candidatus Spongiihabitans sp.]|uniref:adenosine deaminase n=1 Tax=Candidatus Spongiihabitans sp. TaxID=3101308 RepID=UPI003C7CB02E
MKKFIHGLPKVELHCHIEGTFEPELMFELAERNGIALPYSSVAELRHAYDFTRLQDFLDIYYRGMNVLQTEQDFFDLTFAYLTRIHAQNVRHTEIFFDPQGHLCRGIAFAVVINGISRALQAAERDYGISSRVIMCFLRHLDQADAFNTLELARPYREKIIGVGLDSSERDNPPEKFEQVFAEARNQGYLCVAHAGEEGPPEYIYSALDRLQVHRIDHGNSCLQDPALVERLVAEKMPLTVCPLSNTRLCVVPNMTEHPLKRMLDQGMCVTVNSDDPAYFGGYMNENFATVADALNLSRDDLAQLTSNAIDAAFIETARKHELKSELAGYVLPVV